MPKLSKDKRDRLILVIVITIALCAGLWYGVITTRQQQLDDSKARIRTAKDKLEKARIRVKQSGKVEAQVETAMNQLKEIESSMASGADLFTWAYLLLQKAGSGQDVKIIEVTRPVKGEVGVLPQFPYQAAIFTVRGAGHYHDFGKFLADFENNHPYFRVQNLSLASGYDSTGGPDSSSAVTGEEKLVFP